MRLLTDFLPLLLFFGTFKLAEHNAESAAAWLSDHLGFMVSGGQVGPAEAPVMLATLVVIGATLLQFAWLLLRRRRIEPMLWVSLVLVVLLGGATIWLHDESFIKWKPSLLYWAMGLSLWGSQVVLKRNLLRSLMGGQVELPARIWRRLNFAWVSFFGCMGLLNMWVAHSFSTEVWVDFKVFGGLGLMLVFVVVQGLYLSRHVIDEDPSLHDASTDAAPSQR